MLKSDGGGDSGCNGDGYDCGGVGSVGVTVRVVKEVVEIIILLR